MIKYKSSNHILIVVCLSILALSAGLLIYNYFNGSAFNMNTSETNEMSEYNNMNKNTIPFVSGATWELPDFTLNHIRSEAVENNEYVVSKEWFQVIHDGKEQTFFVNAEANVGEITPVYFNVDEQEFSIWLTYDPKIGQVSTVHINKETKDN